MGQESVAQVGERIFALIDAVYGSDAAFERAANLPPKTVNNWRRGRSASYMKLLPEIAMLFGVATGELLGNSAAEESARLTSEEEEILAMFRAAGNLSDKERAALTETIRNTIGLYLSSHGGGGVHS
jgi:transcriptional regulator with XRE-family HTH domain